MVTNQAIVVGVSAEWAEPRPAQLSTVNQIQLLTWKNGFDFVERLPNAYMQLHA